MFLPIRHKQIFSWLGARYWYLGVLTLIVFALTFYQLRFFWGGPTLEIDSHVLHAPNGWAEVIFKVHNTHKVSINGRPVTPHKGGTVSNLLPVQRGWNIISVDLESRYGRYNREYLYVQYPHVVK